MAPQATLRKVNPSLPRPTKPVELDPHLALLAAVYQLAIRDAQHGTGPRKDAAVDFLMATVPDWVQRYRLLPFQN